MRITDKQVQQVLRAYSDQIKRQEQKSDCARTNVGHEIKLSPASQEFLVAKQALRDLPPVNAERVAELRRQIATGTYQLDSRRIAQSMLAGHHLDKQL